MIASVKVEVEKRGITRLCHFTPSRNLVHIVSGQAGILGTKELLEDQRALFTPTDTRRLDGHLECVCCSIEYPNTWYLAKAQEEEVLFPDWVIVLISPKYLWTPGTLFCPRNAAAGYGRYLAEGEIGYRAMFAPSVTGAAGRTRRRAEYHLPCCPTDDQAEVLIPTSIPASDILGIVVRSEAQAKNELARLRLVGVNVDFLNLLIAPELFDRYTLSARIREGVRPIERVWNRRGQRASQ
jgi:hypothetical protein